MNLTISHKPWYFKVYPWKFILEICILFILVDEAVVQIGQASNINGLIIEVYRKNDDLI